MNKGSRITPQSFKRWSQGLKRSKLWRLKIYKLEGSVYRSLKIWPTSSLLKFLLKKVNQIPKAIKADFQRLNFSIKKSMRLILCSKMFTSHGNTKKSSKMLAFSSLREPLNETRSDKNYSQFQK